MGWRRWPLALLVALWLGQLATWAAGRAKVNPRIIAAPQGAKEYVFPRRERFPVFFHQENTSSIYVGGEGRLYYYDFATGENYTQEFPVKDEGQCVTSGNSEDSRNYLTLVEQYGDGLLVCGTGACAPTCWNVTQRTESPPWDGRGIAPFTPDSNGLVLVDGQDIYSTIKKSQQNGKIPRFRRVRGGGELYTSDTVMQNPQFVKATALRLGPPHQHRIYYFFREENPDKSPEAPRNVSRVAQLCKGDQGGTSSLSASKWTTFLKATLICVDPVTKGNFNWLQDVFFVPDSGDWRRSKAYGLFTNTWGSSAVCVYSFGDIADVFRTSALKGYSGPTPEVKPGQCVPPGQHTPAETFKIADSHPEVAARVEPLGPERGPLFHNQHRYRRLGVHRAAAADGRRYSVLYLATDQGSIHKVLELPWGVQNVLELQLFPQSEPIEALLLDHARAVLYVGSAGRVLEVPMATCGAYRANCHSCVLATDPYCGWADGACRPLAHGREVLQNLNPDSWRGNCQKGDLKEADFRNVSVTPFSRHYLNCSIESRYASYAWYHEDALVQRCDASRPRRGCFHFIPSVRREHLGHYVCVSEEDGFRQALVKERLLDRQRSLARSGRAPRAHAAPLGVLLVALVVLH